MRDAEYFVPYFFKSMWFGEQKHHPSSENPVPPGNKVYPVCGDTSPRFERGRTRVAVTSDWWLVM